MVIIIALKKHIISDTPFLSLNHPLSLEPVCTLPNVEYGTFSCKTPSGRTVAVPGDGVVCTLTCDAGPFIVHEIDPEITCRSSAFDAQFDKTPSCSKWSLNRFALLICGRAHLTFGKGRPHGRVHTVNGNARQAAIYLYCFIRLLSLVL